jgi:hypothetical protein
MAFQLKRTFELIDPSTFDSAAALRAAAKEYYRDLTFDGDDEGVEEDIWLARRPAACDPDNYPAVLVHAFTKICVWSRDFAYVLHLLTGWPMMAVRILTDDVGSSETSFVRNPDGRLLDASGWVDEAALLRRLQPPRAAIGSACASSRVRVRWCAAPADRRCGGPRQVGDTNVWSPRLTSRMISSGSAS